MSKHKEPPPVPVHSVSLKVLGLSIDGHGLGGVIAVPVILIVIAMAGATVGKGAAWLASLSQQSVATRDTIANTSAPGTKQ